MPDLARLSANSSLPPDVIGTAITVGTFDGVHLGHRDVLERLAQRARESSLKSVLVTFDPHPLEIVNPAAAPPILTTIEEKTEVIAESGVDYMAIVPFTKDLAAHTAEQFVDLVLRRQFRMRRLLIGYDHGFGRQRAGDANVLRELGGTRGFEVEVIEAVVAGGQPISSTSIRRAVAGGDLAKASAGLGRFYPVNGIVVRGEQRGRLLGFPTINISLPSVRKLLPPEGVYAARVQTPRGPFGAMLNLGPRPTFGDERVSLEAHLFETGGDFYGCRVRVEFVARLRETRKFDGVEALIRQLHRDAEAAQSALTRPPISGNLKGSP
jgi:riboflavin kinase / FMN adenylyltransferase